MIKCSSCNTEFDTAPESGICSNCGDLLDAPGAKTEVHIPPTFDLEGGAGQDPGVTSDLPGVDSADPTAATQELPADSGDQTAATMPLPEAGPADPGVGTAATIELSTAGDSEGSEPGDDTAATLPLPGDAGGPPSGQDTAATVALPGPQKERAVQVAPRKLSVANMRMITDTWQATAGKSGPRTSLKVESISASGTGSSLVVNPRGVRSAHSRVKTTVGADYELLEVIGKGGMGVVYSARQASVDRLVAVKMIRPKVAADVERREKFLSEAVVTGDLDHPNIVPIYELGTNESNALFYSMKQVKGTPWSKVIGKKPVSENVEILLKVADAVAFAHANGVVHRDLKPDNVMLGGFGEVLVMDWGLALATATFRHSEFVSDAGNMGGTPAYMAPEMVTGPFELIGPAADVYLLGAILYEIVTSRVPHGGKTAQECLLAAARNDIQPAEQFGELVDIALRAMATDPADRFASVQEFQSAIRAYQSHCESTLLSDRADQELAQTAETGDYDAFARALFGFQEALALWDGNTRARTGIAEAKLAYAHSAKRKGDYELGISLLDADEPDHAALRTELAALQRERDARHKRLIRLRRIAAAMVVVVFGVISVSLFFVAQAKNRESAAKEQAIQDRDTAVRAEAAATEARKQEEKQKRIAIAQRQKAEEEEAAARAAEAKAREAEEQEREQKLRAVKAERIAKQEEQKAILAKRGEEYSAYVARIGMAAAKIDENAFLTAEDLLAACLPAAGEEDMRHWEWGYLKQLCRRGTNFSATGTVNSVAFSPDGKWFVTAGEDGKAHFWDRASGKEQLTVDHGAYLHAVAVSPDGGLVATAGGDGVAKIWRAADGTSLHTLSGHEDRVLDVAFSPQNGRWLLTASRDRTVRVWDTTTGSEIDGSPLRGHAWWVWSAAFAPDESSVVTAGQDGRVIIWSFDANAGQPAIVEQATFLGHDGPVFTAAFSPDGRYVASAGFDERVLLWEPDSIRNIDLKQVVANAPTEPQKSRSFEGHSAPIRSVAFSADGRSVLSAGDDNTVRIWDTTTGRLQTVLRGHSRPVRSCAFSPDEQQVASAGMEGQIKLWDVHDFKQVRAPHGRLLLGHQDAISSAAFSADGRRIVTASRDHTARVYDAQSGECLHWLKEGHDFLVSRAIFFNRGRWLVTSAGDNSARIWDAVTGSELCALEGTGRNSAVAVSRDGDWILTGVSETAPHRMNAQSQDNPAQVNELRAQIALWQLNAKGTSARQRQLQDAAFGTGHHGVVTTVAMSPDGRLLFSGDDAGGGILWDAATGARIATTGGHVRGITDSAFSSNGSILLTASLDGTVSRWNTSNGRQLAPSLSHVDPRHSDAYDAPVKMIALAPDGRRLLTLSESAQNGIMLGVVRLWDLEQASVLRELYRGPETITSVAFAERGRAALAAGTVTTVDAGGVKTDHKFVRRWDLTTLREVTSPGGRPFLDFQGRQESIWAAIDAPDGQSVLTIGGNGASLWNATDLDKPVLVYKPHSGVTAASFSPNGHLIATSSTDRRAKIWNADTGRSELQLPSEHTQPITSVDFSPVDDHLLVTASYDGTARVWQLPQRQVLHVLDHREQGAPAQPVRQAAFSPDGERIATAGDDRTIRVWDARSGNSIAAMKLDAPALCVAYSADGQRIIAGARDGRATIFDAGTGQPLVQYLGHTAAINSVALSPDGHRALTGSSDRTAKIWDTLPPVGDAGRAAGPRTGKEILTLKHHDQAVASVAFSPDGRSILTAGQDGTAVLWLSDDWRSRTDK